MSDFESALESAMADRQFIIRGKINYNTMIWQRFPTGNRPTKGKPLFVRIHDDRRGATFGDWHNHEGWVFWRHNISTNGKVLTYDEQSEYRYWMRVLDKRRTEKRDHAIKRVLNMWSKGTSIDAFSHPYVLNKRITPYYAHCIETYRWIRNVLFILIHDVHYQFMGLQIIKADGFKRFWKGTTMTANMIWLSQKLPPDYAGVIHICEGYATGCSIYEAIGSPVVCALNNYNLIKVCTLLREQFRFARLVICADNDAWTIGNPGITAAMKAMDATGAILRIPNFDQFDQSSKPTDFNDLFCLAGIEAVENQLIAQS